MPSARAAFFMANNEFMFSDGRTKLSWPEWKAKAEEVKKALKKGTPWQQKAIQLYGQPFWEVDKKGKPVKTGLAVADPSKGEAFYIKPGKGGLGRTLLSRRKANQLKAGKTRQNRQKKTGTDFDDWVGRLDDKGWPEGKSLDGFLAVEKAGQTELYKEIERLKKLGLNVTDGHIVSLANENVKASPLERKGQGGSHTYRSRVPEIAGDNYNKGPRQDVGKHTLRQGGIATTPAESLQLYLTGDEGTGVNLTTPDKQRIGIQGEDPNLVIAQRQAAIEKAKQNGHNGENGHNGKNGKNGKVNGGALSAAGKTRKVDAIANIGLNAATGNYAGVAVGGGALAMTAALQNRQTQQALGKQIGKLVSKRAGRTMMKAVPGLDVLLSGQETVDYLKQGKLDQAGIAAVSGAVGWIPIIGDGVSASLDLTNTGIDISRLQVPTGTSKKKGIIRPKSATRRLKFST